MKRKTLTAILGVAMALSLSTAAAAAPKGGAVIEINEPVVLCDASNPN